MVTKESFEKASQPNSKAPSFFVPFAAITGSKEDISKLHEAAFAVKGDLFIVVRKPMISLKGQTVFFQLHGVSPNMDLQYLTTKVKHIDYKKLNKD